MGAQQERRLLFGEAAEQYDAARPSYPAELIDDVVAFAPATTPDVLEVGAGTGKATLLFAARNTRVVATEPGDGMVDVLRRNCAGLDNVTIEQTDFETFDAGDRAFDVVTAAQSWHWVSGTRYDRAAELLRPDGAIALFWNLATLADSPVRRAITAAYREHAPDSSIHVAPIGHDSYDAESRARAAEIDASGRFRSVVRRTYWWPATYRAREYADMTATHSDHLMLADDERRRLADAVTAAIDSGGGTVTLDYGTELFLARRA